MGSAAPGLSTAPDTAGTARARGRLRLLVGVLGGLLVAALVGLALLWSHDRDLQHQADLRAAEDAAAGAASDIAEQMTSYDYRTVGQDFAWVRDDGTASFRKTYEESTKPIQRLVVRTRAHAEGKVSDAAATAQDADHVTVLLFVDQALQHPGGRTRTDSSRVVMDMVFQGGRWLVDDVQLR